MKIKFLQKIKVLYVTGITVMCLSACNQIEVSENVKTNEHPELGMYVIDDYQPVADLERTMQNCGYTSNQLCVIKDETNADQSIQSLIDQGCSLIIIHAWNCNISGHIFKENPSVQFLMFSSKDLDYENVCTYEIDDSNVDAIKSDLSGLLSDQVSKVSENELNYTISYAPIYEEAITVYQELHKVNDIHYVWGVPQNCIVFDAVRKHRNSEEFMTQWEKIMEKYTNEEAYIYE